MLKTIRFDEYSTFFGYRLKGLTSFTVFLGQNNSGKTALLDYIFEQDSMHTNYISMEELLFLFSDKTVNVPKNIQLMRKKALRDILDKFDQATEGMRIEIFKLFKLLTDMDMQYHQGEINHFVQIIDEQRYVLDITEIGGAYLTLFAALIYMLWNDALTILIDEPELSLHAEMQKKFYLVLKKISRHKGKQLFIATHSQLFLDRERPTNNFKIKIEGVSRVISQLRNEQDLYIATYQLLGNSPADIMMPSNFIIVEGPSDKIFLVKLMQRFYTDKLVNKNIIVQTSSGDITNRQIPKTLTNLEKLYSILDNNSLYQDRVVILVDQQDRKVFRQFKTKYDLPHERLRSTGEINKYALEETYPEKVLERLIKKYKSKPHNPRELVSSILKNKGNKKIEWAKRVGDEIRFDEVPQLFKEVIETAIKNSI